MSNQLFNQKFEDKMFKAINLKSELIDKCMTKVRLRQNVDYKDLLPLNTSTKQVKEINSELEKMKSRTLFLSSYFFLGILFSIKQTFKFRRLRVGYKYALRTWGFSIFSSLILFKLYEGKLQAKFENLIEDLVFDNIFELKESEILQTKKLCNNALEFYKNTKFTK